jgi:hypothetical protein
MKDSIFYHHNRRELYTTKFKSYEILFLHFPKNIIIDNFFKQSIVKRTGGT